jgi:hypothetical protein
MWADGLGYLKISTDRPQTNHVPREYSASDILQLQFMEHIMLFPMIDVLHFHISTFRSVCAVTSMAVFRSFLTSWIPGTLLMYFLNDFEVVPVAPPCYYRCHVCFYIPHALCLYRKIFIFQDLLGFFFFFFNHIFLS